MSKLGWLYALVFLGALIIASCLNFMNLTAINLFELGAIFVVLYFLLLLMKQIVLEGNKKIPLEKFRQYPKELVIQGRYGNDGMAVIRRRYLSKNQNPLIL